MQGRPPPKVKLVLISIPNACLESPKMQTKHQTEPVDKQTNQPISLEYKPKKQKPNCLAAKLLDALAVHRELATRGVGDVDQSPTRGEACAIGPQGLSERAPRSPQAPQTKNDQLKQLSRDKTNNSTSPEASRTRAKYGTYDQVPYHCFSNQTKQKPEVLPEKKN